MEREGKTDVQDLHPNITHLPFHTSHGLRAKWDDFSKIPKALIRLVRQEKIDFILCRAAPAGALGYLIWRKTKVPYAVESFEPHADYMLESGVWSRWDPRFLLERFWEARQKKTAKALMPVAEGYRQQLIVEGVPQERIFTQPCAVPSDQFWFRAEHVAPLRKQLGLTESNIVGIYVGKFGGLYLEEEAFRLFQSAFSTFGDDFFLILLSPNPADQIADFIHRFNLPAHRVLHTVVPHTDVPSYLHAADFAFATYKPSTTKRYLSPIKVGEYWASGLPVVITHGVGDESEIIPNEGGGTLYHPENQDDTNIWSAIRQCMAQSKAHPIALAKKYRSLSRNREVYQQVLKGLKR